MIFNNCNPWDDCLICLLFSVGIIFIDREGDETLVQAKIGETLLDVAKDNDIDLEGKAEEH